MGIDPQRLYSVDEAAELLSKPAEEVHKAAGAGELKLEHGVKGSSILAHAAKHGVNLSTKPDTTIGRSEAGELFEGRELGLFFRYARDNRNRRDESAGR